MLSRRESFRTGQNEPVLCERCETEKASVSCAQCGCNFCPACNEEMHGGKWKLSHKIIPIIKPETKSRNPSLSSFALKQTSPNDKRERKDSKVTFFVDNNNNNANQSGSSTPKQSNAATPERKDSFASTDSSSNDGERGHKKSGSRDGISVGQPRSGSFEESSRKKDKKAKGHIQTLMNRFLVTRPSVDVLLAKGILLRSDAVRVKLVRFRVQLLVDHLIQNGLEVEGLFRISASETERRDFWESFEKCRRNTSLFDIADPLNVFSKPVNPHVVAACLKLYIREQEDPFIPNATAEAFFKDFDASDTDEKKIQVCKNMIEQMEAEKQEILELLFGLFRKVTLACEETKMTPANVGIVWGPNLFKPKANSPQSIILYSTMSPKVISFMIVHVGSILPAVLNETKNEEPIETVAEEAPTQESISPRQQSNSNSNSDNNTNTNNRRKSVVRSQIDSIRKSFLNQLAAPKPFKQEISLSTKSIIPFDPISVHVAFILTKTLIKKKKVSLDTQVERFYLLLQVTLSTSKKSLWSFRSCIIAFTQLKMFFFDGDTFDLIAPQHGIYYGDLKELVVDASEKGFFSIEEKDNKPLYFLACSNQIVDYIVNHIEKGRTAARNLDKNTPILVVKKSSLFSFSEEIASYSQKLKIGPALDFLTQSGFSEEDLWSGRVDLEEFVKMFALLNETPSDKMVVEFIFPELPELAGMHSKSYLVDKLMPIGQMIEFICNKLQIKHLSGVDRYCLTTLRGSMLSNDKTLAHFGLGSLFTSWQVKLVDKTKGLESARTFFVEFLLPHMPDFHGQAKKTLRLDAYMSITEVIATICAKLKVRSPHRFELKMKGEVLQDTDSLSTYGLGIKFPTMTIELAAKYFPVGTNPVKDTIMVRDLIQTTIFDGVWDVITDHIQEARWKCCYDILQDVVEGCFTEIEAIRKAATRIALLKPSAQEKLCMYLHTLELEEKFSREQLAVPGAPPVMSLPSPRKILEAMKTQTKVDIPTATSLFNLELRDAITRKRELKSVESRKTYMVEAQTAELYLVLRKQNNKIKEKSVTSNIESL